MRDFNRDGKVNGRDYYDDLGGAYYFRPPGLDSADDLSHGEQRFVNFLRLVFYIGLGILLSMIGE